MADLLKTQTLGVQADSPSAAVPPAAALVQVDGTLRRPFPADLAVRQTLRGLMPDGSVRDLLTLNWPGQTLTQVQGPTATRVWIHIDPSSPVAIGETITFG